MNSQAIERAESLFNPPKIVEKAPKVLPAGDGITGKLVKNDTNIGEAPKRVYAKRRPTAVVPVDNVETIRQQLKMTKNGFAEALGITGNGYYSMLQSGLVTRVTMLAAQGLLSKYHPAAKEIVKVYEAAPSTNQIIIQEFPTSILKVVDGIPVCHSLSTCRSITLDDKQYWLVEK